MELTNTFDTHIKAISTAEEWEQYKVMTKQPTLAELDKRYIQETLKTEWERPRIVTQNNKAMKYRVATDSFDGIEKGTVVESSTEVHGIAYFPGDNKWYANEHYINAHNQYFEPVGQVTEGQYWKWEEGKQIFRIQEIEDSIAYYKYLDNDDVLSVGTDYLTKNARKLSTDEIEQALIKEAKRRGLTPQNTVKRDLYDFPNERLTKTETYDYDEIGDELWHSGVCLYRNGNWAEIVDQTPHIEINGYEVELNKNKAGEYSDDLVKVGCRDVYDRVFKDLGRYADKFDLSIVREGEDITDQIREIAEYYE